MPVFSASLNVLFAVVAGDTKSTKFEVDVGCGCEAWGVMVIEVIDGIELRTAYKRIY
jgi:hypothetical protein